MSVNGVTNTTAANDAYQTYKSASAPAKEDVNKKNEAGAVYEPSGKTKAEYKADPALIAKLKADNNARIDQLRSVVEQMISKQGNSYGQANDMWKFLSGGNFTVTDAAKAQAQKDISEDGYWGVNQTSDRILEFAKALTGGDPDKIQEMKNAFEKGFRQATGAWGKDLPDISGKTYDAVMQKFDAWEKESSQTQA